MSTCKEKNQQAKSLYHSNFNQKKSNLSPLILTTLLFISICFPSNIFADGLVGKYYDSNDFTNLKVTRVDETINHEWGNGSPDTSINNDNYSAIWTGYIYFPENSTYTFHLAHDDKFMLNIDGTELYNNGSWTRGKDKYKETNAFNFTSGYYPITISFIENGGGAYAKFAWSNTNSISSRTIVPTDNLFTTLSVGCDDSLDSPDAADSTPGTLITSMNDISIDTSTCISGSSESNDKDYYYFTVASDGLLNLTTSSPNSQKYHLKVGSSFDGNEYYGDTKAQNHTVPQISLSAGDRVYLYVKETGNEIDEYQINFDFTAANTSPPLPSDEDIPTGIADVVSPICGVFEDALQTHDPCSAGSEIFIKNETLVYNNNSDTELSTCTLLDNTLNWGLSTSSCDTGECTASGTPSNTLDITYENLPVFDNLSSSPITSSTNLTLPGTFSDSEINTLSASDSGGDSGTLNVTNSVKINSVDFAANNTLNFEGTAPYNIEIGSLSSGHHLSLSSDEYTKNIKIKELSAGSNHATINLTASQTIKMSTFTFGNTSTVTLKAQYVQIDNFDFSSASNTNLTIYADYLDIGDIVPNGSTATITIKPYTPNKRILARFNNFYTGAQSEYIFSSGNYYVNDTMYLHGSGTGTKLNLEDSSTSVNFYLNKKPDAGNNFIINADALDGDFNADRDATQFNLFVNGDFETGTGGTTINATVYAENDISITSGAKIKGALSAGGKITSNGANVEVTYDQKIDEAGWAECLPKIQFTQGQYSFDEPAIDSGIATTDYYTITAAIDIPVSYDITVEYETYNDDPLGTFSAQSDLDYTPYTFLLTIPAGELNTTIKTTILRDDLIELDETFNARLLNPLPNDEVILGDQNTTQLIINGQDEEDIPLCFADDFDNSLDNKWRLLSSVGGWTPRLVDNTFDSTVLNKRLRLTDRQKNLATAVTKDYEFLAKNNMIIVEFDQFAYGGCEAGQSNTTGGGLGDYGADGIVMTLFDSQVGDSPTPGAYGGSMGYAQGHGLNGFQAGWIGLGIDEYGNFSNPTEGRDGGSGFHPNNITIRGSSDTLIDGNLSTGSLQNGYKYLKDVHDIGAVASKNRLTSFPGHRYKLKIDARDPNKLYVSLERDSGSGYTTIIPVFDAKEAQYNQAPAPEYLRLAFTSGSGGGCNNHDIDELSVKGVCRAYEAKFPPSKGAFDAWEVSGDISDRDILTKVSNKDFNLTIASINSLNNAIEVKEDIIMQYRLYDTINNISLSSWQDYNASTESVGTTAKGASERDSFKVPSAHKNARVQFSFCGEPLESDILGQSGYTIATLPTDGNGNVIRANDGTVSCDGNFTEILNTYSTDNFAIRPEKFDSNITSNPIIAGKDYNIEFSAGTGSGADRFTTNYDEHSSFDVNISLNNPNCAIQDLNISPNVVFSDGNHTADFLFDNVGDFNLSIKEKANLEFAKIDENDTLNGNLITDDVLQIEEYKTTISILPHHFDVNASYSNGSNNFTYMSNFLTNTTPQDIDISSLLELNITAKDENNVTLSNYTDLCYAKDGNISIEIPTALTVTNLNNLIWYENVHDRNGSIPISGTTYNIDTNASDFNSTIDGKSELSYRINFDRNSSLTENPFVFTIQDISITDSNGTFGTKSLNESATFYYGRVHAPDYRFDSSSDIATVYYEVYSNKDKATRNSMNLNGSESVDSIDWYINTLHLTSNEGIYNKTTPIALDGATISNLNLNDMTVTTPVISGTPKLPHKDKISMTSNSWLIYNPTDFIVEFYKAGAEWAGEGQLGDTVDTNVSTRQNRRLDW